MKKTLVLVLAAAVLAAGYFGFKRHVAAQVAGQIDARLAEIKSRNGLDIGYGAIDVSLLDKSAVLAPVVLRSDGRVVPIESVTVYKVEDFNNALNIAAKGIDLTGQKDRLKSGGAFPSPDKADLRLDFAFDPAKRLAELRAFQLKIGNYGEIDLTAALIDPPGPASSQNALRFLMELSDTGIQHVKLKYTDRNLIGYALADEAGRGKSTPEAVVDQYCAELDGKIAKYRELNSPEMVDLLQAFKDFAKSRKGIEIVVAPDQPVKLGQMPQDEREAITLLKLKARSL